MDTYSLLREIADSWVLLMMVLFFLGTWVWAFWPTAKTAREAAAAIPFTDEPAAHAPCTRACAACACKDTLAKLELPNG